MKDPEFKTNLFCIPKTFQYGVKNNRTSVLVRGKGSSIYFQIGCFRCSLDKRVKQEGSITRKGPTISYSVKKETKSTQHSHKSHHLTNLKLNEYIRKQLRPMYKRSQFQRLNHIMFIHTFTI